MTADRYARLAGRLLSRSEEEPAPPSREARAQAIDAIGAALARRRRRALWMRGGLAASALAAAAAVAVVATRHSSPPPVAPSAVAAASPATVLELPATPSPNAPAPVRVLGREGLEGPDGEALAPGSRIVARPRGHAILAFAAGTRLTVEDGGDVTLVDDGPQPIVEVEHGTMRAVIAGLREGERFVVRTRDAELDARGVFRVAADAAPCGGASTRVQVDEGTVVVRHGGVESRVDAGETWPRGCASAAGPSSPSRPSPSPPSIGASGSNGSSPRASAPSGPGASSSTLAEQNDLFASAVAAKQAGDASSAVERFETFTRRFPGSPLAENATVERMRLLRGVDAAKARVAARAYLSRWPDGFAKSEAEGLLSRGR